jgi:transglutaminase-like putative cysteine protease
MSSLLLLLFMTVIPTQSETLQIALPLHSSELIQSFGNSNFTQNIRIDTNRLICETEARDYQALARPFRIVPDPDFIETLSPALGSLTRQLLADRTNLGDYMASCSSYLKTHIRYQESSNSDDPDRVLSEGRANCIGYCSLFTQFLKAAGIHSRISRGFYLKLEADGRVSLIPHRWLEITLDRDERIFFDPQYQSFRAHYLKTDDQIQFTKIKKFSGRLLKQGRRLSNQEEP